MYNGLEAGPTFVMVTLNLRTALPAEAGRSLTEREACLLGEISTLGYSYLEHSLEGE